MISLSLSLSLSFSLSLFLFYLLSLSLSLSSAGLLTPIIFGCYQPPFPDKMQGGLYLGGSLLAQTVRWTTLHLQMRTRVMMVVMVIETAICWS